MEVLECLNGKIGMLYKSYPKLPAIPEWDNTSLSLPVAGVVDTIFYKVLTLKKLYNSQLSALCKALILCLQRGRDKFEFFKPLLSKLFSGKSQRLMNYAKRK